VSIQDKLKLMRLEMDAKKASADADSKTGALEAKSDEAEKRATAAEARAGDLEQRAAAAEARVGDLEAELEQARSQGQADRDAAEKQAARAGDASTQALTDLQAKLDAREQNNAEIARLADEIASAKLARTQGQTMTQLLAGLQEKAGQIATLAR